MKLLIFGVLFFTSCSKYSYTCKTTYVCVHGNELIGMDTLSQSGVKNPNDWIETFTKVETVDGVTTVLSTECK